MTSLRTEQSRRSTVHMCVREGMLTESVADSLSAPALPNAFMNTGAKRLSMQFQVDTEDVKPDT